MNDLERTQNFLQKAKEKFPQFDYSLVTSIKNMEVTKVSVICPEHGEFITTPKVLLKGKYGCPKCANKLKSKKTDKNTLCTSELPKDLIGIENPIVCDKTKIVGTIYCFINTINNKLYIGETVRSDFNERFNEHRSKSDKGIINYFYNAVRKHGWDNFNKIILRQTDVLENTPENKEALNSIVNNWETELIAKYNTTNSSFGYNLTSGGDGIVNYTHTEETKKRLSETHSGENHWHYGKLNVGSSNKILQFTETGELIKEWPSAAEIARQLGFKTSNISNCCNNKIYSVKGFIFVKEKDFTETYIKDRKQLFNLPNKEVLQFDFLGNFIKEYNSCKDAGESLGKGSVSKAASGVNPQAHGYIWIYKENFSEELLKEKLESVKYCRFYQKIVDQIRINNKL